MQIIDVIQPMQKSAWDTYVRAHPQSYHFHLYDWKTVIAAAYGYPGYYLMAVAPAASGSSEVRGVLPLIHFKTPPGINRLISLPFLDISGILASDRPAEEALFAEAVRLGKRLGVESLELRQPCPLTVVEQHDARPHKKGYCDLRRLSHKASLKLELPPTADKLFDSFKSKLRSQIKKALKNELEQVAASHTCLDDFYRVFSQNMRDLGSPVHAKSFFHHVLRCFPDDARMLMVRRAGKPVAASFVLRHGHTLHNPWASSLRQYRSLSTNMLLYWSMLSYAADQQVRVFDFGRSTRDAGTYRFKRQWGAVARPLSWYYLYYNKHHSDPLGETLQLDWWKKIPVAISKVVGPVLRKRIAL